MFSILSKTLPLLIYPIGLTSVLILAAILLRKRRWQWMMLLAALLVLWLGSNRVAASALMRSLEYRYLPPAVMPNAEAIVALGGGTHTADYPRPMSEVSDAGDRFIYAAKLYHEGYAPHILVTGGGLPWRSSSAPETDAMLELLEMLGVPAEAIWMESESSNTYENALFSRQILEEKGINRVLLVTSAFHMPRSVPIFERQGFEIIPAPTDFRVSQADWEHLWTPDLRVQALNLLPDVHYADMAALALKEYVGMIIYRLRRWL